MTDSARLGAKEGQLSPSDIRFLSIGVLSAILFFIGERTDAYLITFVFKPLPIFCLIAWCQWKAEKPSLYRKLIQIGLFMGSLGMCCTYPKVELIHVMIYTNTLKLR